jgi:excisionase family DNA binding protein
MNLDDIRGRATISVPEAGEVLGIGRDASYEAAGRGEIPTLRLGRSLRVPVPSLLAMLDQPGEPPRPARPDFPAMVYRILAGVTLTAGEAEQICKLAKSRATG